MNGDQLTGKSNKLKFYKKKKKSVCKALKEITKKPEQEEKLK